jgi:hypothetical protein
MGFYSI